jgi:DMSO/TMAO reductase YedYZ molybdopterin-dependent catalytic subunit
MKNMKKEMSRRDFFRGVGGVGLGTIGLGFGLPVLEGIYQYAEALTEEEKHTMLTKGTVNFKGFMAREITPNEEFYVTSYSAKVPALNADSFRLGVEGLVERPYTLSMKDLAEMKDKTEFVTLECIGNSLGGDAIGNALWEGVTLRKIIEKAAPKEGAVKTVFHAEDGYTDSIPYSLSISDDVFLAFRMNGEPLSKVHGYPLRAIVPGIYGMKNVKWLSKITLVRYDYKGYWQKRGWSDAAVIPIKSQILMPMDGNRIKLGDYVIGGVAFAGRYGIGGVQVSLDGGKTWHMADTKPPLSKWAWVIWRYGWKPAKRGKYKIAVRGIDKAGKVQEKGGLFEKSLSAGAKGWHTVTVRVV